MTEEHALRVAIDRLESAVSANVRAQTELSSTVKDLRAEIASTYVRKDVLDPTLNGLKEKVKAHGDWMSWATRIVLSLVIVAVVGVVLYQGGEVPS